MTKSHATAFVSTRIITDNLDAMVAFYEQLTDTTAVRPAPVFAEILTPTATLAIGSTATVPLFAPGSAEAAANRSAILEFLVDDVDTEYARVAALGMEFVAEPAVMPWATGCSSSVTPTRTWSACSAQRVRKRSSASPAATAAESVGG